MEERLAACGDWIFYMRRQDRNYELAKTERELIDLQAMFGNQNPLELEIGCGKGQFSRELARQNPDVNFLAVEQSSNVLVTAAEQTKAERIPNLRFIRGGAEYLLCYLPAQSVRRIYLNFSCPFPKKSYAAHRLTHRNFLAIYRELLAPDGSIIQKTDSAPLFEFSVEEFSQSGFALRGVTLDLHHSPFAEENIITEYEQRFLEEGKPIYRLEAYLA